MDLYHFHRVLTCSAIVFCAGFGAYAWHRYANLGQGQYLLIAVGSALIGAAMLGYLVYFNVSLRRMRHDAASTASNSPS